MKLKYIVICTTLLTIVGNAQEKQIKKGNALFDNFIYQEAIASYEELIAKGYSNEDVYKNLGNANYFNANYEAAAGWFEKLVSLDNTTLDAEYFYKYAQSLKSLKKYKESDDWMRKFETAKSQDNRGRIFGKSEDYLSKIKENSGRYTIKSSSINSTASDFAPSFNGSQLVFSTARDSGITSKNIHQWTGKAFLNLYEATINNHENLTELTPLSKKLNKKTHESSTVFTKDGKTMYFTRNNSENGAFSRDEQGVSRLKIYKASLINNTWDNIIELPFNSDSYSVAHPTLSPDESKLYFASDMPGTLGASDIFMVNINDDGTYSTPINLGPKVNTEARETFPFISSSNKLYFASDGHPGLGGLDIFALDLNNLDNGVVLNVGAPVNSEEDDFTFIINESTRKGYFASNRKDGLGSDDIYSFVENTPLNFSCITILRGIVKDEKTSEFLPDTRLTVINAEGETVIQGVSDSNGNFTLEGDCTKGDYTIVAAKTDYNETTFNFTNSGESELNNLNISLKSSLDEAETGDDLAKKLNLEKIYFDFDKANIRRDAQAVLEKVVTYLKQYPNTNIQIGSHTDARGNDNYNLALSNRRAKATLQYLITQGIDENRLSAQGFGETNLTNNCDNTTKCSEEEHQLNRRSVFLVIK
ncbi:OmpA family protein [Cellulophaga tyrosinoxydans]|uniref:Outer membrane protein OmpA n=1 Tax=Cellulophaga tyrosinoxydans TaxID=504486 RepID=A0A1W2AJ74_9FLAO|nr:OmpA family protein [Cellulophaga tyrosinoxydans]SMC60491.1 Outer membrane protein OmpA [Cellulophaga tyrosinoxydans]